jgi:hypothetical protein
MAGGDRVATRQRLQKSLREALSLLDLDPDRHPRACQPGDVVANACVALLLQERLEVGGRRVVAEHRLDRLQEGALAARRGTMGEEQLLLTRIAGERVADRALEKAAKCVVTARDPFEEALPERRTGIGLEDGRAQLCEQVGRVVCSQLARPQVERPVPHVEQPGPAIEL